MTTLPLNASFRCRTSGVMPFDPRVARTQQAAAMEAGRGAGLTDYTQPEKSKADEYS